MPLTIDQTNRLIELQNRIKAGTEEGKTWKQILIDPKERDEYVSLKEAVEIDQDTPLPKQFILNLLDNLYMAIKDGDDRAHILSAKREVQRYV